MLRHTLTFNLRSRPKLSKSQAWVDLGTVWFLGNKTSVSCPAIFTRTSLVKIPDWQIGMKMDDFERKWYIFISKLYVFEPHRILPVLILDIWVMKSNFRGPRITIKQKSHAFIIKSTKISGFYRDFIKMTHIYYSSGPKFLESRSTWPKIFKIIMFDHDKQRNRIVSTRPQLGCPLSRVY